MYAVGRERRLRQLLEEAGEDRKRDDRERGDDQARELAGAPAPPLTAVLERLPLTTIPLARPAARFAPPRPSNSRLLSIS